MPKTTKKTITTKAASKKPAPKKVVKKTTTKKAPAKKVVAKKTAPKKIVKKTVAKKAPAKKVAKKATKKSAAKKTVASKRSKTVVEALIDVGFGNLLYIRGDAPGLSWETGVPMDCVGNESWSISMSGVNSSFEYKVLINDIHWESGSNNIAKPGSTSSTSPSFE